MSPARVVLAEDHSLVRAGFRRLLEGMDGVEVIAEAADGRAALAALKEHEPDLLVLDLTMPELNGIEVLTRARKKWEALKILVVSMHTDRHYVLRAFSEGADGYLVKAAGEFEMELAVTSVLRGRRYVSPEIAEHLLEVTGADGETMEGMGDELLTPRQREVLQLIAEGYSTSEIAKKLFISVKTVETHRADIQRRLGMDDVASLVRYAIRSGMVSPEV
ncbi:MAG: response regulator transcription factor [Longimicrobiales bacterium]|nr:response regulator transcription factor [Longimicrobiales bacterium]